MRLLNPTGGLVYHLRAKRYRDSLWVPFRNQISQFLDDWTPPEKELLVLGPSGGYTLTTDFLERFDRVWLMDPDRLAPIFFRKNHSDLRTDVQWSREDLIFEKKRFAPEKLQNWLEDKEVAVVFSNLLGQLPLLSDVDQTRAWWTRISPALSNHSWLSYHDVFSFRGNAKLPARLPDGPVVPQLVEWAIQKQKPLELIDHGTSELFPNSLVNWTWNFSPRRTHVVGGICTTI